MIAAKGCRTITYFITSRNHDHKVMRHQIIKGLLFLFIMFLLIAATDFPVIGFEGETTGQTDSASKEGETGFSPGMWIVSFYRNHISAVDGDRCPSFPSCSSYSVQAIKKHGFSIGWMMTVDRLIHEGKTEASVSPLIYDRGKWKIYDPVENNDFWWYTPDRRHRE